ncbi:restriction endonuclease subunit S [bacterium]|nr:restriction endonuclease subunit S [bacterium]
MKLPFIKSLAIPIPPLPEQKRIVKTLDKAFTAIDKAKENAEKNLKNAKELFDSYLQNIFASPGKDWEEKKLETITNKIGSGATPRGGKNEYKAEGLSLIRSLNVYDNGFAYKKLAFINQAQADKLSNVIVESGDVLLNITGASICRCTIVPDDVLPARVNQHVSIIRLKQGVMESKLLWYILISKVHKDRLLTIGEKAGATRQALTKNQLEEYIIYYPRSLTEQKRIVAKLNALSAETKRLESIYQQKISGLEELKQSVLQKAFEGGL